MIRSVPLRPAELLLLERLQQEHSAALAQVEQTRKDVQRVFDEGTSAIIASHELPTGTQALLQRDPLGSGVVALVYDDGTTEEPKA